PRATEEFTLAGEAARVADAAPATFANAREGFLAGETAAGVGEDGELFNRSDAMRALRDRGRPLTSLPRDLQEAISRQLISREMIIQYLDLEGKTGLGIFMKLSPGFRARMLADPKFMVKMLVEQGIGLATG